MTINDFFKSKTFKGALYGVGTLIILMMVFQAGAFVGFKKAEFTFGWGNNYYKNFAGPRAGMMPGEEMMRGFEGRDLMNGHGVVGSIIKIDAQNIIIKGQDNLEKIIVTDDKTQIMNMRDSIKITDLKQDDNLVIIGSPDESGQITAKLIRVLPTPPAGFPMPNLQNDQQPATSETTTTQPQSLSQPQQ